MNIKGILPFLIGIIFDGETKFLYYLFSRFFSSQEKWFLIQTLLKLQTSLSIRFIFVKKNVFPFVKAVGLNTRNEFWISSKQEKNIRWNRIVYESGNVQIEKKPWLIRWKKDTDVFFLSYNFNLQSLFILIKRKMTVGKVYRCCDKSEGRKISKRKGKLLELWFEIL